MAATKKVKGDRALLQRIATIQAGVGALVSRERLGAFLVRRMKDRFDREVDPEGNRWKGRADSTRGAHKLLNRTGRLRGAIGVLGGAGGTGFGVVTGAGFRIGVRSQNISDGTRTINPALYGKVHHQGNKHVPQRRFLGIGALDVKAVDSLLRREMNKLIG